VGILRRRNWSMRWDSGSGNGETDRWVLSIYFFLVVVAGPWIEWFCGSDGDNIGEGYDGGAWEGGTPQKRQ
jgi:hypothetical protein